ncbi:MAG: M14 family metallopeptidase [Bacteroidota bacterium]
MNKFLLLFSLFCSFPFFSQQKSYDGMKHYVVEDTAKYTYAMIVDDLAYLYVNFPQWVHPLSAGKSEFGLQMSTVRIGYEKPKKKSVFLVGNIHAREDYSSKLVMKFLNVFLLNLEKQDNTYPNALKILDSVDIYIMPVANPDGLKIAHQDWEGIADSFQLYKDSIRLIESYEVWKANGKGIDLNATFDDGNHPVKRADNYSPVPCSEGYKGKIPAEPKETQAIQRFVGQVKPLMTVSFHTKGNILYWADKKTHPYFREIDTKINREVAVKNRFVLGKISRYPAIYGCGLENYVRAKHKLMGTCVELSRPIYDRKQFPDNEFNKEVWDKAWKIPYMYLELTIKYSNELVKIAGL